MSSEWRTFTDVALTKAHLQLVLPLVLAVWMGWQDLRTNRIPNYLTFGTALAGLGYQACLGGWTGLGEGLVGLGLGFGLLILFYWKGGLGAGDVKALAALGAWLGPWQTLYLFVYMAFSGVLLAIIVLLKRGLLWSKLKKGWASLLNKILLRPHSSMPPPVPAPVTPASPATDASMPYGVALAMGMVILSGRVFFG